MSHKRLKKLKTRRRPYIEKSIGPEGGEIALQGCVINFPIGAVNRCTKFRISILYKKAYGGNNLASPVLECEPSMQFLVPVKISLPMIRNVSSKVSGMRNHVISHDENHGTQSVDNFSLTKGYPCHMIHFESSHFSLFWVFLDYMRIFFFGGKLTFKVFSTLLIDPIGNIGMLFSMQGYKAAVNHLKSMGFVEAPVFFSAFCVSEGDIIDVSMTPQSQCLMIIPGNTHFMVNSDFLHHGYTFFNFLMSPVPLPGVVLTLECKVHRNGHNHGISTFRFRIPEGNAAAKPKNDFAGNTSIYAGRLNFILDRQNRHSNIVVNTYTTTKVGNSQLHIGGDYHAAGASGPVTFNESTKEPETPKSTDIPNVRHEQLQQRSSQSDHEDSDGSTGPDAAGPNSSSDVMEESEELEMDRRESRSIQTEKKETKDPDTQTDCVPKIDHEFELSKEQVFPAASVPAPPDWNKAYMTFAVYSMLCFAYPMWLHSNMHMFILSIALLFAEIVVISQWTFFHGHLAEFRDNYLKCKRLKLTRKQFISYVSGNLYLDEENDDLIPSKQTLPATRIRLLAPYVILLCINLATIYFFTSSVEMHWISLTNIVKKNHPTEHFITIAFFFLSRFVGLLITLYPMIFYDTVFLNIYWRFFDVNIAKRD